MRKLLTALIGTALCSTCYAQQAPEAKQYPKPPRMVPEMTEFWTPQPKIITPADMDNMQGAPSDAIILFDGKDASQWEHPNGSPVKWDVANGTMTVKRGTGEIRTKRNFGDYQLHIEWSAPTEIVGESQGRGNTGIFMQGRYEVQVLDNYDNETYANGQAGSIYKQTPPLVNAMQKPGKWNVYDIIYTAPRFGEDGALDYPARITLLHNGVVVQNNTTITGSTEYIGIPKYTAHGDGPISLQDHGNPVRFRNIWIREL